MFSSLAQQTFWTGWLVALLLAAQMALPYLLRKIALRKPQPAVPPRAAQLSSGSDAKRTALAGNSMRWHYFLGFILPAGVLAHAWIPMASGHMPRTSMTGLWLATYALGLLFLQLLLGLTLQRVSASSAAGQRSSRLGLNWVHFGVMLAIAILALAHMFLNRD
jgi:hypothetical protein